MAFKEWKKLNVSNILVKEEAQDSRDSQDLGTTHPQDSRDSEVEILETSQELENSEKSDKLEESETLEE